MNSSVIKEPKLSVGIPTFNRAHCLAKAVASVQHQQYANWEIIVSDNGSTDETRDLIQKLSREDPRIREVRFAKTVSPTFNFLQALSLAAGDYFMWLADDDWLDPAYAVDCIGSLEANPGLAMVAGASRYYRDHEFLFNGALLNLEDADGLRRVLHYYRTVSDNSGFYGIYRTDVIRKTPLRNIFGGDWLCLAAVAYQGKVRTITTCFIHRDFNPGHDSLKRLVRTLGGSRATEWMPFLSIALAAARDVVWSCPIYRTASLPRRAGVAVLIFWTIIKRYVLGSWAVVHCVRRWLGRS